MIFVPPYCNVAVMAGLADNEPLVKVMKLVMVMVWLDKIVKEEANAGVCVKLVVLVPTAFVAGLIETAAILHCCFLLIVQVLVTVTAPVWVLAEPMICKAELGKR